MQLIIDLPDRDESLAFHRKRWGEVLQDRCLAKLEQRIETNAFGEIVMTPPPSGSHSTRQYRIARTLESLLGDQALTECPVITVDGVKAIDAAWYTIPRFQRVRGQQAFDQAPEICVEVFSPGNTRTELQHKFRLYFDAGAIECWLCDLDGRMHYFKNADARTSHNQSELCPNFPNQIED